MKRSAVLLLAIACTPYQAPVATYPLPEALVVDAAADSLWPAIVDVVNERQFSVKLIDRASGFLQSERLVTTGSKYWDCGLRREQRRGPPGQAPTLRIVEVADEQPIPVTMTISAVAQGAARTRVRVTANVGMTSTGQTTGELARCVSKGVLETELLQAIEARWHELRK